MELEFHGSNGYADYGTEGISENSISMSYYLLKLQFAKEHKSKTKIKVESTKVNHL